MLFSYSRHAFITINSTTTIKQTALDQHQTDSSSITLDSDLQCPASYGHNLMVHRDYLLTNQRANMQQLKVNGQSNQKRVETNWWTYRWMEVHYIPSLPMWSVTNVSTYSMRLIFPCDLMTGRIFNTHRQYKAYNSLVFMFRGSAA